MAVYITEYASFSFVFGRTAAAQEPAIATTVLSSATTSTGLLSSRTQVVRVVCDAPAWLMFSGSSISTGVATSTNAARIVPGGPPEYFGVRPSSRYTALST
jgi:hypothetical protein